MTIINYRLSLLWELTESAMWVLFRVISGCSWVAGHGIIAKSFPSAPLMVNAGGELEPEKGLL